MLLKVCVALKTAEQIHRHPSLITAIQRYLVNDFYWKKHDGPVFLYIGGEGALSMFDVLMGTV